VAARRDEVRVAFYLVKGGGHAMPGVCRGAQRETVVGEPAMISMV
jgi:poly(3-hydroxybutyrate) depolymerase